MRIPRYATLLFCVMACALGSAAPHGSEVLRIQVSPSVARAPALLTVRVTVQAAADNRSLRVSAESPDFYSSSEIQIDGRNSTPLNVFEFRNLPTGVYQVTGVLVGTQGTRATASGLAKVEPSVGSR